jgi:hypothetical protein
MVPTTVDMRHLDRLPADDLHKVTAEHVWNAVQRLSTEAVAHAFSESREFDLLGEHGVRLPPKAVFGLAATEALGMQVLPKHFSGGIGTPCFRILEDAGFEIVRKGEASQAIVAPPTDDEEEWEEGSKKLVLHLRSERARGMSRAKKARFLREYGRLFCERCGFDPVTIYGEAVGASCIEVHHRTFLVAEMKANHKSRLEDLACLCANCHRVTHKELRLQIHRSIT